MSTVKRDFDKPYLSWEECSMGWDGGGCIVAMPHEADPLKVGMAVRYTEIGCDEDPRPDDVKEVTKTWGRIWTLREQWEYEEIARRGKTEVGPIPENYYGSEGVPGWSKCAADHPDAQAIWIISWASS